MADDPDMDNASVDDGVVYLCDIFDFNTISGALFIVIFIISISGNSLLLCVLFLYENLKNATNLFVLNVACSDLLFTLTLPFWAVYYLHDWVFGDFLCKWATASYYVGMYSSIILLTAMTVDRFITVVLCKSLVRRWTYAVCSCVAAWVISIAASLSNAITITVETSSDNFTLCEDVSEGHAVKVGYYLQASLLFFLPFAVIVFCYAAILKKVLQLPNKHKHRATVAVVLCIVAAFFVCCGPLNVFLFTHTFYEPEECGAQQRFEMAYSICRILAYSHCCMNPLLYMMSQKLRKHLTHFLCCKCFEEQVNVMKQGSSGTSALQTAFQTSPSSAVRLEM